MKVYTELTYKDDICESFDVFNSDKQYLGYIVKYYKDADNNALDNPFFDAYSEYDAETDDYCASCVCDNMKDSIDFVVEYAQ